MSVAHPSILVAVVVLVGALAVALRVLAQGRRADAIAYTNLEFFAAATRPRVPLGRLLAILWLAGAASIGTALAGPRVNAPVVVRDAAVVLCIDTSGSMAATDVAPTRADAAARAARTFIDTLPSGTRIAIVAFASSAVVVQPPTNDKTIATDALARIPPPNGGTAIGDALETAARTLPPVAHRAIVLVTDGVNNAGADPLEAAPAIGASGTIIDTVGIGTAHSGQLIPGTMEEADLDETALRTVAADAHGTYARAGDAGALEARLRDLARSTTLVRRRIDAALPLAVGGGAVLIVATLAALAAGVVL